MHMQQPPPLASWLLEHLASPPTATDHAQALRRKVHSALCTLRGSLQQPSHHTPKCMQKQEGYGSGGGGARPHPINGVFIASAGENKQSHPLFIQGGTGAGGNKGRHTCTHSTHTRTSGIHKHMEKRYWQGKQQEGILAMHAGLGAHSTWQSQHSTCTCTAHHACYYCMARKATLLPIHSGAHATFLRTQPPPCMRTIKVCLSLSRTAMHTTRSGCQ